MIALKQAQWVCPVLLVLGSASIAACSKDPPPTPSAPPTEVKPVAAPAAEKPAAPAGAPGAGDFSGSSIANAKALKPGVPLAVTLPCSGSVFVGPFTFNKDPERVLIQTLGRSNSGGQECLGGSWQDKSGTFLETAGFGCPEGTNTSPGTAQFDYSPGNGGHGANPVFLELKAPDGLAADCKPPTVTLTLPAL